MNIVYAAKKPSTAKLLEDYFECGVGPDGHLVPLAGSARLKPRRR
jgi:hypothetical protein